MNTKVTFVLSHWGMALLFILSAYGWGALVFRHPSESLRDPQSKLVQAVTGLVILSTAFLLLGVVGHLQTACVAAVLGAGILLTAASYYTARRARPLPGAQYQRFWSQANWPVSASMVLLIVVSTAPLILAPLSPPHRWDEVMYHLPHAREWAREGQLTVNEWLRYPWAPLNINILYAAAMLVQDDVLPRVLHALCGFLCASLLLSENKVTHTKTIPWLAALIWLSTSKAEYGGATIDLGLTLFVLTCFLSAYRWTEAQSEHHWLYAASLSAGMAAGIKYQALMFIFPYALFIVFAWLKGKINAARLAACLALGMLPCIYWYARNWIVTGNPVNPLASSIFGYYDWTAGDMAFQLFDLKNAQDWPPNILIPAFFALAFPAIRKSIFAKITYFYCLYAFIVWYFTSHHARYLMPAYPLMAWLSAITVATGIHTLYQTFNRTSHAGQKASSHMAKHAYALTVIGVILLSLVILKTSSIEKFKRKRDEIAVSKKSRDIVLERLIGPYPIVAEIVRHDIAGSKLYQWGMENLIYYLPRETRGDHFGPWRYRDMPGEPKALYEKLRANGMEYILMHPDTAKNITPNPDFSLYFSKLSDIKGYKLYELIHTPLKQ